MLRETFHRSVVKGSEVQFSGVKDDGWLLIIRRLRNARAAERMMTLRGDVRC